MKYSKLVAVIFIAVVFLFVSSGLVSASASDAYADADVHSQTKEKPWFVLAGYGATHTNLGQTKAHVETVDLIVGYEKVLTDTFGPSLLKGRYSLVVEAPISFVVEPWEEPIFAINFLARWTFATSNTIKKYVFGGGGPVYTQANIPGLGAKVNGNWQFGGGVSLPTTYGKEMIIEYRFHHISNAGVEDPNDPLNSSKILIGFKF